MVYLVSKIIMDVGYSSLVNNNVYQSRYMETYITRYVFYIAFLL